MTIYVAKAKPKEELMADLRQEISSGRISRLRPFEEELQHDLENARMFNGYAYWVEEDYYSPLLHGKNKCTPKNEEKRKD